MAAAKARQPRAPRHRQPLAEKRRVVELTLGTGASGDAIAREHNVHPNSLYQWRRLYRAGELDAQLKRAVRVAGPLASASFVPVTVVPAVRSLQPASSAVAAAFRSTVQLVLATGATLRIETAALDAALVCALVAELQR